MHKANEAALTTREKVENAIREGWKRHSHPSEIADEVFAAMSDPSHSVTAAVVPPTVRRDPALRIWRAMLAAIATEEREPEELESFTAPPRGEGESASVYGGRVIGDLAEWLRARRGPFPASKNAGTGE